VFSGLSINFVSDITLLYYLAPYKANASLSISAPYSFVPCYLVKCIYNIYHLDLLLHHGTSVASSSIAPLHGYPLPSLLDRMSMDLSPKASGIYAGSPIE